MSYSNGLGNLQHLIGSLATNGTQNSNAAEQATASKSTQSAPAHYNLGSVDATQLSKTSSLFSQAIAGSDVRTEKVAALQQSIANGTYNVSSSDVATSIIGSLLG